MLAANALAANVSLYQPALYDLARDITPVSLVGRVPVVLAVSAGSPHTTIARFIAAAKAAPSSITYASRHNRCWPGYTPRRNAHWPPKSSRPGSRRPAARCCPHRSSGGPRW